jgi:excisionase family DNA binding protein
MPDPTPQAQYLNAAEVAEAAGTTRSWVYYLAAHGKIPAERKGNRLRFPPEAVELVRQNPPHYQVPLEERTCRRCGAKGTEVWRWVCNACLRAAAVRRMREYRARLRQQAQPAQAARPAQSA